MRLVSYSGTIQETSRGILRIAPPGRAVIATEPPDGDQLERLTDQWNDAHVGVEGSGALRVAIATESLHPTFSPFFGQQT